MSCSQVRQRFISSQGLKIAVYEQGNPAHPTVVLLHGYPDNARVWQPIATQLADKFHVVTFDMRGCGQSSVPAEPGDYTFEQLSEDLKAVLAATSPNKAVHMVGHDWGALVGWEAILSGKLEGRVASWSAAAPPLDHIGLWFHERLATPTPANLVRAAGRLFSSSYMLVLQLPLLPELTWRLGLQHIWPACVSFLEKQPVALSDFQLRDAINGLGLYRKNFFESLLRPQLRTTQLPVQLLKMSKDPFVSANLFEGVEQFSPQATHTTLAAGHWGLLSQPEAFSQAIEHFITHTVEKNNDTTAN